MSKSTLYKIISVLASFVGILTLGGLGNAAVSEPVYWAAFVINIPVYVFIVRELYRKGEKEG